MILLKQKRFCAGKTITVAILLLGASYTVDIFNGCLNGITEKEQSFVAHHYNKITEAEYLIRKKELY